MTKQVLFTAAIVKWRCSGWKKILRSFRSAFDHHRSIWSDNFYPIASIIQTVKKFGQRSLSAPRSIRTWNHKTAVFPRQLSVRRRIITIGSVSIWFSVMKQPFSSYVKTTLTTPSGTVSLFLMPIIGSALFLSLNRHYALQHRCANARTHSIRSRFCSHFITNFHSKQFHWIDLITKLVARVIVSELFKELSLFVTRQQHAD